VLDVKKACAMWGCQRWRSSLFWWKFWYNPCKNSSDGVNVPHIIIHVEN